VLRAASGYLMAERDTPISGASAFDRIFILPTSRVTTATAQPSPAAQAAAQAFQPVQPAIVEDDDDGPPPVPGQRPAPQLPPGVRLPPQQQPSRLPPGITPFSPETGGNEDEPRQAPPSPNNPFGVPPGTAQPGVINPAPPRQGR
jgi:hypothetical protein